MNNQCDVRAVVERDAAEEVDESVLQAVPLRRAHRLVVGDREADEELQVVDHDVLDPAGDHLLLDGL